jgi:hypothetical protein
MTNLNQFLPLQKPTLYILLSLRGVERHGYDILKGGVEWQACEAVYQYIIWRALQAP